MTRSIHNGNLARFWCPGCDDLHQVDTQLWVVTGSDESLTIFPSVLVYGHKKFINDELAWDEIFAPENITTTSRCHSFVTNGQIQFLGDSGHFLANQTVPLPDLPDWCL
jgi:hypothetical protein